MTYNRSQARPLLTGDEFQLFSASLGDRIKTLDKKQLSEIISRTRRARNKYTDMAGRQNIQTARRAGRRAAAHGSNRRTEAKAQIFGEALGRLQKRLENLERHEAQAESR